MALRGLFIFVLQPVYNKLFTYQGYPFFRKHLVASRNHLYVIASMQNFSSGMVEKEGTRLQFPNAHGDPEVSGQIQLMSELIKKYKSNYSLNDFETLKYTVLEEGNFVTKINFDAIFLTQCGNDKAFQLGRDYFSFVYSKGNCKLGLIGKFFRLCYDCREECSENEKIFMLDLYKRLLLKYEILDFKTCENVALGLSITPDWKECLKMLEMAHFTSVPSSKMYSVIIQAAFSNSEMDLGLNLLHEMVKNKHVPDAEIFSSWLSVLRFTKIGFINIFKFFEKYDLHPTEQVVRMLLNYYEENHQKSKYSEITTINARGKCRTCFNQLNPVVLTETEFQKLKDAFLNPVLIGRDVFLKTKPSELVSYSNFLKKLGHVDVVLDGLNIALAPTHRNYNVGLSAQVLVNVVKHFISQSKKVLVLGRKHMNVWPQAKMNYIKQNAFLFLVENVTSDDPFLLYAAMYFGLGTCFVSRDQMRSHKFLLKDAELISIFARWQQKHQYYLLHASEDRGVSFKEPVPYLQSVQQGKTGIWHIPISSDITGVPAHLIPNKRKWLCFHQN